MKRKLKKGANKDVKIKSHKIKRQFHQSKIKFLAPKPHFCRMKLPFQIKLYFKFVRFSLILYKFNFIFEKLNFTFVKLNFIFDKMKFTFVKLKFILYNLNFIFAKTELQV